MRPCAPGCGERRLHDRPAPRRRAGRHVHVLSGGLHARPGHERQRADARARAGRGRQVACARPRRPGAAAAHRAQRRDAGTAVAATERVQLTGAVQEIPASLPVRAGDAIGIQLDAGAKVDSVELGFGQSLVTWSPALADGGTATGSAASGTTIAFSAVVEPDADGDGLGDESQDPSVDTGGGNPPGGGTPPPGNGGPPPPDSDPYAAIRKSGPRATIAGAATRVGRKVSVTVTNPYAFELKGKLQLKRGRKVVAKANLKLGRQRDPDGSPSRSASRPPSSPPWRRSAPPSAPRARTPEGQGQQAQAGQGRRRRQLPRERRRRRLGDGDRRRRGDQLQRLDQHLLHQGRQAGEPHVRDDRRRSRPARRRRRLVRVGGHERLRLRQAEVRRRREGRPRSAAR